VSSTVASGNIAGEFRSAAIPLVFWEQALLRPAREGLAENGSVTTGFTSLTIIDNSHPITNGLPLGGLPVYSASSAFSTGMDAIGPETVVLANREASALPALMAAEEGATLLAGYVTPARRVFMFYEDTSFLNATAAGRELLRRSVDWAVNAGPSNCLGDFDGDQDVDLQDLTLLLANFGASGAPAGDVDEDGDVDLLDLSFLLSQFGAVCP
jgi:hypothetical protein